jgi:TRAP transporter TAXI family solute receptor
LVFANAPRLADRFQSLLGRRSGTKPTILLPRSKRQGQRQEQRLKSTTTGARPIVGSPVNEPDNQRETAMLKRVLTTFALVTAIGVASSAAWSQPKDIRWGTGPVGSSGHKALVVLANLLEKEMPDYRISVLPLPGAVMGVKGYATGEYDAYYGSDIALEEFATDSGRFKGFKAHMKREPVQSFWSFTLEVGLAIKASNRDKITKWADLTGKKVYTGPLPFDTRLKLERALAVLGVKHIYTQVDLSTAGSQLESGAIEAMIIYTAGETQPAPWISQASLAVDWAALNPSAEEAAILRKKGFQLGEVKPEAFHKDVHTAKVTVLPFYWGFDVGLEMPADDVYKMLTIIDKHSDELAKLDPSFTQIAGGKMAEFQKRALEATWEFVPIHPGLAKYMREKGVWDKKWDSKVATM